MIVQLQTTRLRTASEQIEATAGEHTITIFRNVLRDVQQLLKDLGYYEGEVDGLYGEGTRLALESYQQAKGLATTGVPDQRTLFQLYR